MREALKDYICEWEDRLNLPLITKKIDPPLVEYIVDAWKSLEVIRQIKFIRYEYTEKESEININKHIFRREKHRKKKDRYDIKYISDNRVGKLTVYLEITMLETDPDTGKKTYQVYPIKKSMLIPIIDEDGLLYLGGKHYYLIYQLLEKSTYTTSNTLTLKSLMPISLKRHPAAVVDTDNNLYSVPYYTISVFKSDVPVILFYLAKGFNYALETLGVSLVLDMIEKLPHDKDPNKIYFSLSTKCYIEVDRDMFLKYPYIQSIVGAFKHVCTSRVTLPILNDTKVWTKKIVFPNNYEKGLTRVTYFGRLMDITLQKNLKLPEYFTQDIFQLLRWQMSHFNELRLRDNCDLSTKRLRCAECIQSLLTRDFSTRLKRIFSMGNKATIESMRELLKFPGDILLTLIHKSGILRFDENVNDMTFFSKLKYTSKGPNSLGNRNSNNIGMRYRDIHPSHLGRLDLLVCGNSDPGTSGCLVPFVKMDGLYFDGSDEPNNFYYDLIQEKKKKVEEEGEHFITVEAETPEEFYDKLYKLQKYTEENVTVYEVSKEGIYNTIVNPEVDIDDKDTPSIEADAKKKSKKEKEEIRKKLEENT